MLGRLAIRMIDHLRGIDSVKDRLRKTLWVMFDFIDQHPNAILFLSAAIPVSRYHRIAIYENEELIGAFLQVLQDGQKRGTLNQQVKLSVLFDVFMGFITRLGLMHVVRQVKTPLTDDFDTLFNMLWHAISHHEVSVSHRNP